MRFRSAFELDLRRLPVEVRKAGFGGLLHEHYVGHGDHTCTVYQLTREQLIGLA